MYLSHFHLHQLPFRNSPDPRFFFETARHNEALANLIYAVEQRRGFVLLSGEIGSGKTLVTHLLIQHLEDHAQIALIRNTHLNSAQLIRLVCDEFSVQVHAGADKAAMLMALNQFLVQQLTEDRLVVIIIDEAQNLSDKVLEELRMLSNLETSSDKLLQIVLVGQPELRDKVSQPHLEQLRQRIALSYHLDPLTLEEVAQYIQHRLKVAATSETSTTSGNAQLAVFTPEAVAKIARISRGTPRIINGLCDNALLYAFTSNTHTIDEELIDKVLKHSMHLVPKQRATTRSPLSNFGGSAANLAARREMPYPDPMPEASRPASPRPESPRRNPADDSTLSALAPQRENIRSNPQEMPEPREGQNMSITQAIPMETVVEETSPATITQVDGDNMMPDPSAEPMADDADKKKVQKTLVPPIIPFPTLHIPTLKNSTAAQQ